MRLLGGTDPDARHSVATSDGQISPHHKGHKRDAPCPAGDDLVSQTLRAQCASRGIRPERGDAIERLGKIRGVAHHAQPRPEADERGTNRESQENCAHWAFPAPARPGAKFMCPPNGPRISCGDLSKSHYPTFL